MALGRNGDLPYSDYFQQARQESFLWGGRRGRLRLFSASSCCGGDARSLRLFEGLEGCEESRVADLAEPPAGRGFEDVHIAAELSVAEITGREQQREHDTQPGVVIERGAELLPIRVALGNPC